MKRYTKSFFLTLFIYTIIIVSVLFANTDTSSLQTVTKEQNNNLKIQIITLVEPKPQTPSVQKKPEPKKTEIKKIVKKKSVETKKIEPIVKKEIMEPKETPPYKEQIAPKQLAQSVQKNLLKNLPQTQAVDTQAINQKKQIYYSKIKHTIEQNKSYPKIAARRGIEGDVKIQFTLSTNGELLSFKILEGKKIFKKSILEAIEKTFPITPPKDIFTSNLDLSLTLQYKLY